MVCKAKAICFLTQRKQMAMEFFKKTMILWQSSHPKSWLQTAGHALGIWICGCSLFYKRELWASKSAGAHSTKSLKISRCKRWCPKDLLVHAPAAPVLTHSLGISQQVLIILWMKNRVLSLLNEHQSNTHIFFVQN